MNHLNCGVEAEPCGKTTVLVATDADGRFGESLSPYLLQSLCLAIALLLLPLLASAQRDGQHAIGLRVTANQEFRTNDPVFTQNLDLSYRMPLKGDWAMEFTTGYAGSPVFTAPVDGAPMSELAQRSRRFQGAVTLEREWQLQHPSWTFYAGGGLGVLDYASRREGGPLDGRVIGSSTNLTLQGVAGFRYQFARAPLGVGSRY